MPGADLPKKNKQDVKEQPNRRDVRFACWTFRKARDETSDKLQGKILHGIHSAHDPDWTGRLGVSHTLLLDERVPCRLGRHADHSRRKERRGPSEMEELRSPLQGALAMGT